MKCPNCGFENRSGAHFCQRCGAPMNTPSRGGSARRPTKPLPPSSAGADVPTRPLPTATVAFAPLPEGALLKEGQYEVLEVRLAGPQVNEYLVEATRPVRLCPQCRAEVADLQERFCTSCGADLSEASPLFLRYRMREGAREEIFAVPLVLVRASLRHPGLWLPREVFSEAPYGPPRIYLVEPEQPPTPAATLPVPQEAVRVLEWGSNLAQALSLLHRQGVVLQKVGLQQIGVDNRSACWTSLETARLLPPQQRDQAAAIFAQNVAGLAAVLLYLATGRAWDPQRPGPVPPELDILVSVLQSPTPYSAERLAAILEERLALLRRPASVTHTVGYRTDVGRERSLNEDSILVLQHAAAFRSQGIPITLVGVADGMGGHEAGDVASRMAIATLARYGSAEVLAPVATGQPLPNPREWLTAVIQQANRAVHEQRRSANTDMGTTLVAALVVGDLCTIANVGDSRAYHLRPDGITQVTVDHSLVERLVATGQITREEAATHPQRNVIYRTIGDKARVEVDLFEQRLAPGEALLICSDGLSGMVPDEQIWQIWRTSTSPQEACDRLVEAANGAGGEDNISVIVLQVSR
ncbi:MAG: Stp1/IreP family PP2C-type Ser/Thr phosphatase [Anaerolineae bacterium]